MRGAGKQGTELAAPAGAYAGWIVLATLAAVVPPRVELTACALMAAVGLIAVVHWRLRPVALIAAVGVAIVEPALIPWMLAAGLLQVALETRVTQRIVPAPLSSELQRALMRGRRRGEDVVALVAVSDEPPADDADELLDLLRATDSYELAATERHWELRAVFEGEFERDAVERRLRAAVHGMRFGWADFPSDGATLEMLLEHARDDLDNVEGPTARPVLSVAQ